MMIKLLVMFLATSFSLSWSKVIELTDKDFRSTLLEFDTALVMFYAPWCGHCKQLKPEFEKAAERLEKYEPPVQLLKIDCTDAGKKMCTKFGVTGYPTVKIFKKGVFLKDYEGPRDRVGIAQYMQRQVLPSPREIASKEDFDTFISQEISVVVGVFKEASTLKDVYLLVADSLRDKFTFGITNMSELADNKDGVIIFRPKHLANQFEPSQIVYQGMESTSDLEDWLTKNKHSLADHRTPVNKEEFKNPLVVAYFNVDYVMDAKKTHYWRNRVLKVAKDFANDFNFAISAPQDFQTEFDAFSQSYPSSEKPVILARSKDNKKFAMNEEFSIENFTTFLTKLKANELEPVIRSEPVPEDNSKPVKVAVAKNFDDVVINNGQDTLIEFYAPWCGHCKRLAPVWDQLGEKMTDEDVTIVKIDATSNDFPPTFRVEGFPSIFWLPKDNKDTPVLYSGDRNLKHFIKYIAKHATKELKNYDRKGKPKKKEEL